MRFSQVTRYFDRDPCYDGYTGAYLFKAQFASFEDASPDGSVQKRRTISLAPELVASVPTHRVVTVHNDRWILGTFLTDGFQGTAVRTTAAAKYVTDIFYVLSPAEAALNTATTTKTLYASTDSNKEYMTGDSSEYVSQYEINVASSESGLLGKFLRAGSRIYYVRSDTLDINGHTALLADAVEWPYAASPFLTVTAEGAWNPVTETAGTPATFAAIAMPRKMLFRDAVQDSPKALEGDTTLLVAKSAYSPKVGTELLIGVTPWVIQQVVDYHDAHALHVRRA
jgi:hypothetical protein